MSDAPPDNSPEGILCRDIKARYQSAKSEKDKWVPTWELMARWCFPRTAAGMQGSVNTGPQENQRLWDSTAVTACSKLTNNSLASMSPMNEAWFSFQATATAIEDFAPDWLQWLAKAAKRTAQRLLQSNFYTVLHEATHDISGLGTGAMIAEWDEKKSRLVFTHLPVGTYSFEESENGEPNELYRELPLTARQAVAKWGKEKLSKNIVERAAKPGDRDKLTFIHAIYPRESAEGGAATDRPYASVYLEPDCSRVIEEDGYHEQPFAVCRFTKWSSATGRLYGYAPILDVLPDVREVNFERRCLNRMLARMADPSILAPEELDGELDPNPGGVTYFSKDLGENAPKPWLTAQEPRYSMEAIKTRQDAIEDAFFVTMFEMLGRRNKEMTATEVQLLENERTPNFSSTFHRRQTELLNVMLERVFSLLYRAGDFDAVPDETATAIPFEIVYETKLARLLQSRDSMAYYKLLERAQALAQVSPASLDNYDWDKLERANAIIEGLNPDNLHSEARRKEIRDAREQAQQQQQAQQAALTLAQKGVM